MKTFDQKAFSGLRRPDLPAHRKATTHMGSGWADAVASQFLLFQALVLDLGNQLALGDSGKIGYTITLSDSDSNWADALLAAVGLTLQRWGIIRAAMHYRAIGKATCHNCQNVRLIDTDLSEPGFIDAKSEAEAAERFRLIHSLCPTCLKTGTPVAVKFDSYIHVDSLPRFGIK